MPINPSIRLRDLTPTEFDERDVIVMRCAYAAQNALGRLCDERVYENDVALRLRSEGFTHVYTQVPVVVTHRTFAKENLIDLIADDALYECKTVSMLAPPHDAQALHYAMLFSVRHAKLLNFRATKVQGRLRFNALTDAERRRWVSDDSSWREASDGCAALKRQFCELFRSPQHPVRDASKGSHSRIVLGKFAPDFGLRVSGFPPTRHGGFPKA